MEKDKEFIKKYGKSIRVTLRNSKLSTDKLQRRIELMRKSLTDDDDRIRLDAIEKRIKSIIDKTGKDQFSEEDIDIIVQQELGLDLRQYDKSHIVNLDIGEILSIDKIVKDEVNNYTYRDTSITRLGSVIYTDWQKKQDMAGLSCYKVEGIDEKGEPFEEEVFSRINIGRMDLDTDYRAAVIDVLLNKNNITKTNCGGYIGEIQPTSEVCGLEDTVKANGKFSLLFNSADATVVIMLRNIVKERQQKEQKEKNKSEGDSR